METERETDQRSRRSIYLTSGSPSTRPLLERKMLSNDPRAIVNRIDEICCGVSEPRTTKLSSSQASFLNYTIASNVPQAVTICNSQKLFSLLASPVRWKIDQFERSRATYASDRLVTSSSTRPNNCSKRARANGHPSKACYYRSLLYEVTNVLRLEEAGGK